MPTNNPTRQNYLNALNGTNRSRDITDGSQTLLDTPIIDINAAKDTVGQNITNAQPQNNSNSQTNEDINNKYNALETTSYKELLSSKIQSANAREEAQKYAANSLVANGLGNTGMAQSAQLGIYNTYQQALNNAEQIHQQNLFDIESQRQADLELESEENFQNVLTMLSQSMNAQDLMSVKNEFYNTLNDSQKRIFDYYYSSYNSQYRNQFVNNIVANATDNTKVTVSQIGALAKTLGSSTSETQIKNWVQNSAQNGDIFALSDGDVNYYFVYNNGMIYVVGTGLKNSSNTFNNLPITITFN